MTDYYTRIAKATRTNREDVKKILHAAGYVGPQEVRFEGGNGGSYIQIQQRGEGMVYLEVGETCVVTIRREISVRALAVILTRAQDGIGFEQMINDYCNTASGVANVPLDQNMPKGKRDASGHWPAQEDI